MKLSKNGNPRCVAKGKTGQIKDWLEERIGEIKEIGFILLKGIWPNL